MPDHYATLGVAQTATADEIKRAFRRLASQHHPDKGGDTQKFQEIQAAYDTLGDAQKRAAYDRPQPQFGGFGGGPNFNANFDFNTIFDMFGARFQQPHQPPRAQHSRMTLWITLQDVAYPGPRTVSMGTQSGTHNVQVNIPNGIQDGDHVKYDNLAPGGQDLVITYRIHPNPRWQRTGSTLTTDAPASFWILVAGGDITVVDILGNQLALTVPPGTAPGTLLRARGRGLPDQSGTRGDMLVRLQATLPDSVSPELMAAIKQEIGQ
jgi:DnaJ-class molecular chaperone